MTRRSFDSSANNNQKVIIESETGSRTRQVLGMLFDGLRTFWFRTSVQPNDLSVLLFRILMIIAAATADLMTLGRNSISIHETASSRCTINVPNTSSFYSFFFLRPPSTVIPTQSHENYTRSCSLSWQPSYFA